jgi:mannosyltransferase
MEQHNKTYGFVIAIKELVETVPNLFRYASAYKRQHNFKSQGLWEMFLKDLPEKKESKPIESPQSLPEEVLQMDPIEKEELPEIDPESMEGENYNMCHFWSNFEIARLDFFRSKEYEDFFQMMDRSGGFWAERVYLWKI